MIEPLESRRLLAAVFPTAFEQFEVELINRARANPAAEAARLGIALNEGLTANTISTAAKQPLAINPNLTDAARKHSKWMNDTDTFAHTGVGGSNPGQRLISAGYDFSGDWTWGENIAYRSSKPAVPDPTATAAQLHSDLFIDAGIAGRGHRTNIMKADFREIGAGFNAGDFQSFNALMLTTDFGRTGDDVFLTGVTYNDTTTKDNFYTPGEGIGGATITAVRVGDGATFSTTCYASGGYSLALDSGKYIVTASGTGFATPVRFADVVIGSENVKRDFRPADAGIVRGAVYRDTNTNGVQDAGEPGIAGVLVYLDTHKDSKRNKGELYARTNGDGAYAFKQMLPGSYRVRQTLPSGYSAVSPSVGYHSVTLGAGKIVGGRSFGNQLIAGILD